MKQHFAEPGSDRKICKHCEQPIYQPDYRQPGVWKHIRKTK